MVSCCCCISTPGSFFGGASGAARGTAGPANAKYNDLYGQLMNYAVPNEIRATLPDELEAAREATIAATLARVAYDKANAEGDAGTPAA